MRFEGFVGPDEASALPYRYVPFDVPLRCTRIQASYGFHARGQGACTVDIGLFDVRGTEPLTGGFRGWSGSARHSFFVASHEATPGYLAGPLPSGSWQIILGFYQVPEAGVDWWLELDTAAAVSPSPSTAAPGSPMAATRPARPGWYRGDFHSHTEHSDGANPIAELAAFASGRGLDFLAVTDHNTTSHHAEIDSRPDWPLLLIPGEEVTTYRGHANVWGLREWIDFRITTDEEMHRLKRWVDARTTAFSINHPKSVGPPWRWQDPGFAIREVWQAPWAWYNWESVRDWDEALASGRRITPVGGSDAHSAPPAEPVHPHHVGDPTTWVHCDDGLSEQAVLAAVLAGRTTISAAPDGPFMAFVPGESRHTVELARSEGCDLVLIADGEERWRRPAPSTGRVELPELRPGRYLRAELRSPSSGGREETRALTAPVYPKGG